MQQDQRLWQLPPHARAHVNYTCSKTSGSGSSHHMHVHM